MLVEDVQPRFGVGAIRFPRDPMRCDHLWEGHLWEIGRAYCPWCGSFGRWVNDPRREAARE